MHLKEKIKLLNKYLSSKKNIIKGIYQIDFYNDYPFFYQFATTYNLFNDKGEPKNELIANAISENKNEAIIKTIMETLERFFLTKPEKNLIIGSFSNFKNKHRFIDPNLFFHFPNKQNFTKTPIHWVKVEEINTKKYFFIPAQLVYIYPFNEKTIRIPDSTGTACHLNLYEALLNSLYELIERDAFAKFFYEKNEAPKIILEKIEDNKIKNLIKKAKSFYFDLFVFDITTDLKIPTVSCFLIDKTHKGPSLTVGCSCNLNYQKAIYKAILETFQTINSLRDMVNIKNRKLIFKIAKNIPITERLLYWAKKENLSYFNYLFKSRKMTEIKKNFINIKINPQVAINYLKEIFKKNKIKVFIKKISPENYSKNFSIYACKAISFDLIPLSLDKKFAYINHPRFNKIKVKDIPHPLP